MSEELQIPKFLKCKTITNPDTNRTLEYIDKRPCVAVLVMDHEMEKVLLVKQYRAGCKGHIYEVVAGVVEPDQQPLDALFAELRQEVGIEQLDINDIYELGSFYSSVGWTNEIAHLYIVKLKPGFKQLEQQLDEGECLSYEWVKAEELMTLFKEEPIPIKTAMLIQSFKTFNILKP